MTIDEAIDGLKRIFSNYELDLPRTDSLDIELEIIVLLEELKEYKATLLTPQMIEDLKKSEKQAHKIAIQNAMLVENLYKTIDDFSQSLKENLNPYYGNYGLDFSYEKMCEFIDMYVKQLKEKNK